jgi:hypothetical protein
MQALRRALGQRPCGVAPRSLAAASRPVLRKLLARPVLAPRPASGNGNGNGVPTDDEDCDYISAEFCSIDSEGKRKPRRTVGEMEQDYLQALGAWFYDGRPIMTDEEFEFLKEELLWSGSRVPVLSTDEQRFLEASVAYYKKQPIMPDDDFDALKAELRNTSSIVTAQGPRCSIRSKAMYSDATADYLRMTLLNLPAALLVLAALFAVDDLTGFDITQAIELPPPTGIILLWGFLLPVVYVLSTSITNVALKDNIILKGTCPNCGTDNFTYFGDIFNVAGNKGQNMVECTGCQADITFDNRKRIIVVQVGCTRGVWASGAALAPLPPCLPRTCMARAAGQGCNCARNCSAQPTPARPLCTALTQETPDVKAEKIAAAAAKKAASAAKKKATAAAAVAAE